MFSSRKQITIFEKDAPFVGIYNAHTPPQIEQKNAFLYAAVYQGVRIAGLVHDVGHFPYSHTIEDVLGILRRKWMAADSAERNANKEDYLRLVEDYVDEENESVKLHEVITVKLLPVVETECIHFVKEDLKDATEEDENNFLLFCLFSFEVAHRILDTNFSNSSSIHQVLHQIISGTLDADRLDFTSRDLLCSGVSKDIIDYERLFMFLSFEENKSENEDYKKTKPYILTAVSKTVADIEEFLRKRWKSYKDVNYHHAVHKSELLMRTILMNMAEQSCAENDVRKDSDNLNLPNDFLFGIIRVLKVLKEEADENAISDNFIRLDDSWLDTIIKNSKNNSDGNDMIGELAFGRKVYKSVIKRFADYLLLDELVYSMFKTWSDEEEHLDLSNKLEEIYNNDGEELYSNRIDYLLDTVYFKFEDGVSLDHTEYIFSSHKFLINDVIDSLNRYMAEAQITKTRSPYDMKFFNTIEEELCCQMSGNIEEPSVLFGAINLKNGIGDDCMIRRKNTTEFFRFFSGLEGYLCAESLFIPKLHLYCKVELDSDELLNKLARIVFETLKADIITFSETVIEEAKGLLNSGCGE